MGELSATGKRTLSFDCSIDSVVCFCLWSISRCRKCLMRSTNTGHLVKLEVRRAEELLTSPTVTVILQGEISDKATEVGGL